MLSIIIPTLQEEKYIADTIRHLRVLTIPHEIIVSDGGSSDRTVEIASAEGARVVMSTEVRTPSHQRNGGARAATGEFLLFLDSSVIIPEPEKFVRSALAHFESASVVGFAVPQWIYPERATLTDRVMCAIINWTLRVQHGGSGKFVMVRRSAFDALGGFREDLVTREDGDFHIRLKKLGTVIYDPSLYIYYSGRREHAVGWPKLLWIWMTNVLWVSLFNKALAKEWTPVR